MSNQIQAILDDSSIRYTNENYSRASVIDCITLLCECTMQRADKLFKQYYPHDCDTYNFVVDKCGHEEIDETYVANEDTIKQILQAIPEENWAPYWRGEFKTVPMLETETEHKFNVLKYQNEYIKHMLKNIKEAAKVVTSIGGKEAADKIQSSRAVEELQNIVITVLTKEYLTSQDAEPEHKRRRIQCKPIESAAAATAATAVTSDLIMMPRSTAAAKIKKANLRKDNLL